MKRFGLHYSEGDAQALARRLDPAALSALAIGAGCSGFQCEGGFNGKGEPQNNWAGWEGRPGFARSGGACGFWERFEEDAALLAQSGLKHFRLSIEWARVQPKRAEAGASEKHGGLDEAAIAHYARILAALERAGITPLVTLYHWTHPQHLGPDFWLEDDSPQRFAAYLRAMLPRLLESLAAASSAAPRRFITLNEPNMFALASYLAGRFPHRQQGPRVARRCLENQLLAHLAAIKVIREVYAARGLPAPRCSFNNNFSALYRLDALYVDMMLAPRAGVPRTSLEEHLRAREHSFTRAMLDSEGVIETPRQIIRWGVRALEGVLRQGTQSSRLSRLVDAAYREEQPLDYLAFDYYDPFPWNIVGASTPGNDRGIGPVVDEWDWRPHPRGLSAALALYAQAAPGMPLWIAENGMAIRGRGPRVWPRRDQARRDTFIQAHIYELLTALSDGISVEGYLHWSLWDNYEWGSYQPRFGLLAHDAQAPRSPRAQLDAAGVPALACLGAIARAAAARDREGLAKALIAAPP